MRGEWRCLGVSLAGKGALCTGETLARVLLRVCVDGGGPHSRGIEIIEDWLRCKSHMGARWVWT